MKIQTCKVIFSVLILLAGCQDDSKLMLNTNALIEFEDNVSPTKVFVTPEHIGEIYKWRVNGNPLETIPGNNSGIAIIPIEPNTEIYLEYETTIADVEYNYSGWVKAPPIANKLIIYSINFSEEAFDEMINPLSMKYNYGFHYNTGLSSGITSGGGGVQLNYNDSLSQWELYQPLKINLSAHFQTNNNPFDLEIKVADLTFTDLYCISSEDLQMLYSVYHAASTEEPNLLFFRNNVTHQDYQVNVSWVYEEE